MTASAGRPDLDRLVQARHIPQDEPIFLLRARDPSAAAAVRAWVGLSMALGVAPAVLEEALAQADAMDAWPTKQRPGADHLLDHERLQLEYRLGRRAWRHDYGLAPTEEVLLAFRRGVDAARAEARALMALDRGGEVQA